MEWLARSNILFFTTLMFVCSQAAISQDQKPTDFFSLSVEELRNVKVMVTSASKKEQASFDAPSAIFVITSEDIRRSGATNLPDLIRMVPGADVGQLNSQKWEVSIRGFNGLYADKLLVLVDGRTIYAPLIEGVYWETQDYLWQDIDRIEVIRGPGATLWGANAVNGVINVISKNAKATQGALIALAGGTEDRATAALRYGGKVGNDTYYRVYAKFLERDALVDGQGNSTHDDWDIGSGGFQVDGALNSRDKFMVQGRAYDGGGKIVKRVLSGTPPTFDRTDSSDFSGHHLLGLWKRHSSPASLYTLQAYYAKTDQNDRPLYHEIRDLGDVDFQHNFTQWAGQDIVWGAGYRISRDTTFEPGQQLIRATPAHRTEHVYSAFIQDEFALKPNFRWTIGSKFEHNVFSGFEVQPSTRVIWLPHPNHSIWGSVSRALRTPARASRDMDINQQIVSANDAFLPIPGPTGLPVLLKLNRNKNYATERLVAFELGYRMQGTDAFSMDLAAFYNVYKALRTVGDFISALDAPPPFMTRLELTGNFTNRMIGESYGFEWSGEWRVLPYWKLKPSYAYLSIQAHSQDSVMGSSTEDLIENTGSRHKIQLHSYLNLPYHLVFDTGVYYAEGYTPPQGNIVPLKIPSYTRLDLRLEWKPFKNLTAELVGQNLLDPRHPEARALQPHRASEVERSAYAKLTYDL